MTKMTVVNSTWDIYGEETAKLIQELVEATTEKASLISLPINISPKPEFQNGIG